MARSMAWSGLSQILSSATNFGLTAGLTVAGTTAELGRTASVLAVYLLALTLCRSLFTESLVAGGPGRGSWRWARRRILLAAAGAMVVGTAVGVAVELDRMVLALLIVPLPVLLLQDGLRYLAWSDGRPDRAVLLDGVWLVVSLLVVGAGLARAGWSGLDPRTVTLAWSIGGVASVAVAAGLAAGRRSGERRPPTAAREPTSPARFRELAHSQGLAALSFNLAPMVLALAVSPVAAGAARALLVPFAPVLSLVAGARLVTLPRLSAAGAGSEDPRRRLARSGGRPGPALAQAGVAASLALVASIALVAATEALPDGIRPVERIRPQLTIGALICVLYVAGQLLADGVALGPDRSRAVTHRLGAIALEWGGLFAGAAVGGVEGMIRGWAVGLGAATALWLAPVLRPGPGPRPPSARIGPGDGGGF